VLFHELVDDDMAVVEHIYAVAGIDVTDDARRQITAYRHAHRRGSSGQVTYDLRADFDVSPEDVRAEFDFYLERFPVQVEVR